jgi:integrase
MVMSSPQSTTYDLRKAVWEGNSIEEWNPANWKQWKPKHEKSDEFALLEREYLRIKHSILVANASLAMEKVKVKLKLTATNCIALQGTFPCRPGDVGKNGSPNKQYTISGAFAANDLGVKTAVAKARELDLLLITKQFQWTPELLGKKAQKIAITQTENSQKLIKDLIKEYEYEFWKTHDKNRQGIRTWETHYIRHLKKLPTDIPLTSQAVETALQKTKPNSLSRFYLSWQLKKFSKFCKIDVVNTIDSYATPKPTPSPRKIPVDDLIIQGYHLIGSSLSPYASKDNLILPHQWQWMYGMLATYGLRPHELFAVDLQAYLSPNNTFHLVTLNPELTGGTKTGERNCGIPPLQPDWVDLFDLKNVRLPEDETSLNNKTAKIQLRFRTTKIDFRPYDLRHAYAIRGHRFRIPIKTMADYMGHTVLEHTKTYQRWMSESENLEIYKDIVINRNATTKEALKARITQLEAEISALKAENNTLKATIINFSPDHIQTAIASNPFTL